MMKFLAPALAAATILTIATVQAQTSSPMGAAQSMDRSSTSANLSSTDRDFVIKAARAGLGEIAEAKTALQKSTRQDVKEFAQRMVDDHTKAADQLTQIATTEGLSLPKSLGSADQKEASKLSGESGASFDRDYIRAQRTAHQQAVLLFIRESEHGTNPALKHFAAQTLPTLQEHDRMIKKIPLQAAS